MALKAQTYVLAGTAVKIATGKSDQHVVFLNPAVDITIGGTSGACIYPIYSSGSTKNDREEIKLRTGEELWANGTGNLPILEMGI